jgi:FkbM family methyltransferase
MPNSLTQQLWCERRTFRRSLVSILNDPARQIHCARLRTVGRLGDLVRRVSARAGYYPLNLRYEIGTGFMLPFHLAELLKKLRINCVFDVGANVGQYARMLRRNGYRGYIFSFEPVTKTFTSLEEAARGDERWKTMKVALGASRGVAQINLTSLSALNSFRRPGELWNRVLPTIAVIDKEDVEVHTLDDVFPELTTGIEQCRPFLKLDTQGFDVEVVKGAQNCIGKMLGLQSELAVRQLYEGAPSYLDALAYYTSLGFTPKDFYTVASDGTDMTALEVDCVMVRQASGKPRTQSMQGLKEKTTVAESL